MRAITQLLSIVVIVCAGGCATTYDIYLPNGEQVTPEQVKQWRAQDTAPILPYQLGRGDLDATYMWTKGNPKRRAAAEKTWQNRGATPTQQTAAPVMQSWFTPDGNSTLDLHITNIGYKGIGYNPDGGGDALRSIGNIVTLGLVSSRRHDANFWELELMRNAQPVFQSDLPVTVKMQRGWFANGTFKMDNSAGVHFYDAWMYSVLESQQRALTGAVALEQAQFSAALQSGDAQQLAAAVNSPALRILRLHVENSLLAATANSSNRLAVLASVMDYAEFIAPQLNAQEQLLLSGPSGYTVYETLEKLKSQSPAEVAAQIRARQLPYAQFDATQQTQLQRLGMPDVVIASMVETTKKNHQNVVVACAKGYAAKKICEQAPSDPFGLISRACLYTVKKQFGDVQCPVPLF